MRTPVTLKIKFKSASLDQFIERYSVDVSRGGIFIRTKEPLVIGTQLKFEFQLQDASSLIAGEGTVVWIREHDPARTGVAPGMGVRFDRLAPASQQVLGKILTEKQKRGEAAQESRFDAGVRASASASGTVPSAPSPATSTASTPVATPIVTDVAATARMAAHNDFSGGDSKHETPLPVPAPGLDDPAEEFAEESTRVMQDAVVQALASRTREEPAKAAKPDDGFSDNEPTRHSTPDPEALRQSKGATPAAPAAAPTPMTNGAGTNGAAAAKPAPPPPSRPLSAPDAFDGPSMGMGAISPAAERLSTPPRKSSGSGVPMVALAVVLVGGAVGAYFVWGRGPSAPTPVPTTVATTPPQTNTAPVAPPVVAPPPQAANDPKTTAPTTATTPPPPVAVPVKVERWVDVSSTPPGADVAVDGKTVGKTPYKLHLADAAADHTVELKRVGFVPQTRNVTPADAFLAKDGKEILALAVALEAEPKATPPTPTKAQRHNAREAHAKGKLPSLPVAPPAGDKPPTTTPEGTDKPATDVKPEEKPDTTAAPKEDSTDKGDKAGKGDKAEKSEKASDSGDNKIKTPGWLNKDKPADDKPADDKADKGDKSSLTPAARTVRFILALFVFTLAACQQEAAPPNAPPPTARPPEPAETPAPLLLPTPTATPSFVPAAIPRIDIHTHISPGALPAAIALLGRHHIDRFINLSGGSPGGDGLEETIGEARQFGHTVVFVNPDFREARRGPGYGERMAAKIVLAQKMGARGIKIPKGLGLGYTDARGQLLAVDDRGLDPLFAMAGKLGMPILIHTGDPQAFWRPPTPDNERYDELRTHPRWSFFGAPVSWADLYGQFERRVARNPRTIFIGVHFGNDPEDPARVAEMLARHKNLYIDTAARIPEIGRVDARHDAARMRAFFIRFADRILFGTDFGIGSEPDELMFGSTGANPPTRADEDRFFESTWRWFETDEKHIPSPTPIQGRWTVDGVALPRDVLERVYHGNAERLLHLPPN